MPAIPITNSTCSTRVLEGDPELPERHGTESIALPQDPEQDVLRADEAVIEQSCFFLREGQHPPCPVGKAFEHVAQATAPTSAFQRESWHFPGNSWCREESQRGARGMPRPIMATMSRWTSLVPPPKVKMVWLRACCSRRPRRTAAGEPSVR